MASLEILKNKKIILASQSPRRRNLINGLDISVELVDPPDSDESFPSGMNPFEVPEYLARKKAECINEKFDSDSILVTADTIVLCDGEIINKPGDYADALRMLQTISDNKHTVITGVCLKSDEKETTFSSITEVYFTKLSTEEIEYYLNKYKPYDKAGAYGIQEWIGYVGVDRIEGSFFNVMGLPLHKLYSELKKF
ncbi:MAG: Maf family nucleotide pyrophosphatase [Bacteroidales bacterium]|nr:Maf family nucleotide pyrophosphatase [Bacteroidales bacterium]